MTTEERIAELNDKGHKFKLTEGLIEMDGIEYRMIDIRCEVAGMFVGNQAKIRASRDEWIVEANRGVILNDVLTKLISMGWMESHA